MEKMATLSANEDLLFIGTYTTRGRGEGIYTYRFDRTTGALARVRTLAGLENPSFLAVHPNRRYLYVAVEALGREGAIAALAIDPQTGELAPLGEQPSGGVDPCYVSVDPTGRLLLVANYGTGSVAAFPIGLDGRLGPASAFVQHAGPGSGVNPDRQEGPHAHCIIPDPTDRYALAADLGLDRIMIYRLDPAQGTLQPNAEPYAPTGAGSGPRHLAFHPNDAWVYVSDELDSTLSVFEFDPARGHLRALQILSTVPVGWQAAKGALPSGANYPAHVQVAPSGWFVYASNRGHDSIAILAVDPDTGRLSTVGYQSTLGQWPRHFALDPGGNWLLAANQNSDNVVVFHIDQLTGQLTPAGPGVHVPSPVCVRFLNG